MQLVSLEHRDGVEFSVRIGKHSFVVDHPPDEGGGDNGPSPPELMVAALGGCMGYYMARYCQTIRQSCKGLSIDLVPELSEDGKRIQRITIDLTPPEGFPQERIRALLRAADQCVVHNTLRHEPEIDIEVV